MKYVEPSIDKVSFSCPQCGALSHQTWFGVRAGPLGDRGTPSIWTDKKIAETDFGDAVSDDFLEYIEELARGKLTVSDVRESSHTSHVENISLSKCYSCQDISVWLHNRLVYPASSSAPAVHPDTPTDIRRDYEEASSILHLSPRGAAALLRLAIQKICKVSGKSGKNINDDIKQLVAEGLDVKIQKALDTVRVIGNEAVHPGQLDISDDRATAEAMFKLFNLIVDKLISEPKQIEELYSSLPEDKLKGIEVRDRK